MDIQRPSPARVSDLLEHNQSSNFDDLAILYLACWPFVAYNLSEARQARIERQLREVTASPSMKTHGSEDYDTIRLSTLLRIVRFVFGLLSQILVTMSGQFLAPSFAVHMKAFGFSPSFIGICFAVPGVIYAAFAPVMYLLTERMPKRAVIVLGAVVMSVGMFFVGTSKSLGLENNPAMIVIGLMILGASWAIMSIPVLPEMLEAVEMKADLNYNAEELDNFISGIFVISNGIGEAIGPILSSFLNDAYGFRES